MTSTAKILLASGVLLVLSRGVSSRPEMFLEQSSDSNSPLALPTEAGENRNLIIEELKSKILQGLKMSKPPTGNFTDPRLPTKVIQLLQEEEKEVSRSEPKMNVIVRPINSDLSCLNGKGTYCRKFDFNITSDLESVISVHAYFHKTIPAERLTLSVYGTAAQDEEPIIKLREDSSKKKNNSRWVTFELPKVLALEAEDNNLLCTVEIEGADVDTEGEESPFLVVTKHTQILERKKRIVGSLNENCTCCAESHHITLEDVGWQNWVLNPREFNIKVCRGQCTENLSYFTINYQRIINSFYKINKTQPAPGCNNWAPRCKAEKFASQRMFYRGRDGKIHDQEIPDMLIESCRCL